MNRTKLLSIVGVACVLLTFTSCASKEKEPEARELDGVVKTLVLEHKGTALGINELPIWVETYVQTGITGLEKLTDYQEKYCFVAETTATNLDAGQAWVNGFDMPQTIAKNVSQRVEALFTGAASGSPEGTFGRYFENVVKSTSEITYSGARKMNDWWVHVRIYDEKVKSKYVDEYRIYVLYTIEKDLLDQQVINVIDDVAKSDTLAADQMNAVNKVKELLSAEGLK